MATVPIEIVDNAIVIHAAVNQQDVQLVIDTGDAVGPVFNAQDAERLGLKNLGPIDVSGAGGGVEISKTMATINLGGLVFENEPGAIDPNLSGLSLLGLPFFLKQKGLLAFDFTNNSMTVSTSHPTKHHRRLDTLLEEWLHIGDANTGDEVVAPATQS